MDRPSFRGTEATVANDPGRSAARPGGSGGLPPPRSIHTLYSPEQMRAVMYRERARSDRNGHEFSLVVFRADPETRRRALRLARTVSRSSRGTDEIGRFDDLQVCALLPDTPSFGAWCFARRLCDSARRRAIRATCRVYTYPSGWMDSKRDNGNGNGNGQGPTGGQPVGGRLAGNDAPPAAGPSDLLARDLSDADRRNLLPFVASGVAEELGLGQQAATEQLESLLAHPLPWWKRAMDVAGAASGMLLLSPVMLAAAVAIKLSSPGPVIFRQKRTGWAGREFTIFKFRTMVPDAEQRKKALRPFSEQDGPAFKLKHDPRVTLIGRILRKTSLDELPQLWNVIKGDMSLVGPRPLPIEEANDCDRWHRARLDVTPGLTCIWQVRGRSSVKFDDWVRMDMEYIRRRGVLFDVRLLLDTVPAVVLRRGAH